MNTFDIWTDGANSGPKLRGGWCAIICSPTGLQIAYYGFEVATTSNRMELMAVIRGLQHIGENRAIVTIHLDSAYVKNPVVKRWINRWQSNGWKTAEGTSVANQDLWEQLIALVQYHNVTWHKVKGHGNTVMNNLADNYAVKAKIEQREGMDFV